jgi:RNA polymerase sigma-70 factor (ECF subfamily)
VHSSVAKIPVSPEEAAHEALAGGDRDEALAILMGEFGVQIYRHCRQVVGDDALAADVQQTVFVQAYRDLPHFSGRSSFRTWLFAIARHRCLDAVKTERRRHRRFLLGRVLADRPDMRPGARETLERHADAQAVDRALATLRPEVRIAVLLRYHEDMSYEEMSQICSERPATLQARVARALPKLRRALEKEGLDR